MTNMNVSIRYSSHLPILMEVMKRTHGDVLELGPGVFSTPVLHWLCQTQKRNLLTIENDEKWLNFCSKYYRTPLHKFLLTKDWNDIKEVINKNWDVALVDLTPDAMRPEMVKILADKAKYIVIHDADDAKERHYHYSTIYSLFKYRYNFTEVEPATTVLSNFVDLTGFSIYE